MNYEIVKLEEKTLVGLGNRTSNSDPNMTSVIGTLWQDLYTKGIYESIKNKKDMFAIGLYSDYEKDTYAVTAGCEVTKADNTELITKTIPAGKYAKFSLHGDTQSVVGMAWQKISKMKLERSYVADFEHYLSCGMDNADIDIYIGLKG